MTTDVLVRIGEREIVLIRTSRIALVVDRVRNGPKREGWLVATLFRDETIDEARAVAQLYVEEGRPRCRRLLDEDFRATRPRRRC